VKVIFYSVKGYSQAYAHCISLQFTTKFSLSLIGLKWLCDVITPGDSGYLRRETSGDRLKKDINKQADVIVLTSCMFTRFFFSTFRLRGHISELY